MSVVSTRRFPPVNDVDREWNWRRCLRVPSSHCFPPAMLLLSFRFPETRMSAQGRKRPSADSRLRLEAVGRPTARNRV